MDAASGLSRAGFRLLHMRFIDSEIRIVLPKRWTSDVVRNKIDERHGHGTFDDICNFNPNNPNRISLPWSEAEVHRIFDKVLQEYQAVMKFYTMGTGGGPGAPENYADWWLREEEDVIGYVQQPCNFYLTVVHMWDKQYQWQLTCEQDPLPASCAIDDGVDDVDFNNNYDDAMDFNNNYDDAMDDNEALTPRHIFAPAATAGSRAATAASRPGGGANSSKSASSKKERRMVNLLEKVNSDRGTNTVAASEMIEIMKRMEAKAAGGSSATGVVSRQPHELVHDINESRLLIRECTNELASLKKKKRELMKDTGNAKTLKKIESINIKIKRQKKLLVTTEETLDNQTDRLHSTNAMTKNSIAKAGNAGGDSDDDDDDSSSDEEQ
jgi:hypothetical protein